MKPSQKWLFYGALVLTGFVLAVLFRPLTPLAAGATARLGGLFAAMQPVFLGILMSYLLFPLALVSEGFFLRRKLRPRLARGVSAVLAAVALVAVFFLFCYFILPELARNLVALSGNLQDMLAGFAGNAAALLQRHGVSDEWIALAGEQFSAVVDKFVIWFQDDLANTLLSLTEGLFNLAKVALNLLIGVIVMVYLLSSRDHFAGQSKKILYALCGNRKVAAVILDSVRQINLIFGGFMTGNVLDALLVGVVCFLGLTVLRIPYALVIGVLVGITNLIPVFGPFLGAVPSAFLLLLADPAKCLIFIIFIVVLQQIDGNIVSPVILGGSTGLPAFWVLFSLLLFGHIMGVWGLILGVPLFAALYYLLKQGVNYLLTRRNLPIRTDSYVKVDKIDADGKAIYLEERERSFFLKKEARRKSEREALATILERGGDVNPDPKPDTETKGFKR